MISCGEVPRTLTLENFLQHAQHAPSSQHAQQAPSSPERELAKIQQEIRELQEGDVTHSAKQELEAKIKGRTPVARKLIAGGAEEEEEEDAFKSLKLADGGKGHVKRRTCRAVCVCVCVRLRVLVFVRVLVCVCRVCVCVTFF